MVAAHCRVLTVGLSGVESLRLVGRITGDHMSENSASSPSAGPRAAIEGTTARKRVAVGSSIGATIETYDFIGFGTAAALYFNQVFFPATDPLSGTLLSFATLGIGFAVRPIGGIVGGGPGGRGGRHPGVGGGLAVVGVAPRRVWVLPTPR